ncbi:MAG: DEAD/DEAH box helicase [Acidobacteria bacterium]|nr:DEAD/DEAH box helicase [Acidobacteriota bacterium]
MPAIPGDARPGDVVRIRGERWRITRRSSYDTTALIETDGCDAANRGVRTRFLLPFEPIDRVVVPPAPRVVRPARWRRIARRVLGDATPGWTSLRAATRARFDIVPFQLEPALALVRGDGCRFLIADAVGLGKTVQAGLMIAEVLQRQPDARAIVICPAGLREQWHEELQTRFGLSADVLDTAGVARSTATLPAGFNPWSAHSLVITSIDYVKRPEVMRSLETLIWDVVVLDEAHGLAGRSDRGVAAAAVAGRARCVVMLTATPHSGDAEAFRRLCHIGRLGDDDDPLLLFSRSRADAGIAGTRRTMLLRVRPTAAEAAMHDTLGAYARLVWRQASDAAGRGARLAMAVLSRRACSSAASLERSVERRLALLGHEPQQAMPQLELSFEAARSDDAAPDSQLGTRGLSDADEERRHLTRILALAREASRAESKLAALRRLLFRTTEPAIVFTEYRDTLEHVATALAGLTFARLHGGLTPRERAEALRQFTSGSVRLLLATDAASEGLNLHHRCRLVINLELPWTPLRLEQRVGRVDRIGQTRRVHAVHLVAAATSEELVLSKLAERMKRVRAAGPFAFSPLPGDHEVAEAVLSPGPPKPGEGGGTRLAESPVPALDAGVLCPVLIREARDEATRIQRARSLLLHAAEEVPGPRATVTTIRRRRAPFCSRRALWVFRLLLVDGKGRGLSEELLALAGGHTTTLQLQDVAGRATGERLAALVKELDAPLRRWLHREAAMSTALRVAHARLSAQLLQLGLFDRRNERAAAAQSVLLHEALARSAVRARELAERRRPRVESRDLVFAIAFE